LKQAVHFDIGNWTLDILRFCGSFYSLSHWIFDALRLFAGEGGRRAKGEYPISNVQCPTAEVKSGTAKGKRRKPNGGIFGKAVHLDIGHWTLDILRFCGFLLFGYSAVLF
jgi:hypothetical protein